jgi:hypothetical protein
MTDDTTFPEAFRRVQEALGMNHYDARCVPAASGDMERTYADINAEPEQCTALIRYNEKLCADDGEIVSAAVHEALHLLLADLKHAAQHSPQSLEMEEERAARRLEPLVMAAVFGASLPGRP